MKFQRCSQIGRGDTGAASRLRPVKRSHQPLQPQSEPPFLAPCCTSVEADTRIYLGTWALSDSNNNLFNVRLAPGGKADQLREVGRWKP